MEKTGEASRGMKEVQRREHRRAEERGDHRRAEQRQKRRAEQ